MPKDQLKPHPRTDIKGNNEEVISERKRKKANGTGEQSKLGFAGESLSFVLKSQGPALAGKEKYRKTDNQGPNKTLFHPWE